MSSVTEEESKPLDGAVFVRVPGPMGLLFPEVPYPLRDMSSSFIPKYKRQAPFIVPTDGVHYQALCGMTATSAQILPYLSQWTQDSAVRILATYTSTRSEVFLTARQLCLAIQADLVKRGTQVTASPTVCIQDILQLIPEREPTVVENIMLRVSLERLVYVEYAPDAQLWLYAFDDRGNTAVPYHMFRRRPSTLPKVRLVRIHGPGVGKYSFVRAPVTEAVYPSSIFHTAVDKFL